MPERAAPAYRAKAAAVAAGKRVLVVEDEVIVAMQLEDLLSDMGCDVVGPACRIEDALVLAEAEPVDVAVLDVNLNGRSVCPVAEALHRRGVPVVYATGYGRAGCTDLPEGPVLQKPYLPSDLAAALSRVLNGAALAH
jgi:CheY-like chemotaxis protein